MSTFRLSDLFSDSELADIVRILREADYSKRMPALRAYLTERADALTAAGVLPSYLAYVLEHVRHDLLAQAVDPSTN